MKMISLALPSDLLVIPPVVIRRWSVEVLPACSPQGLSMLLGSWTGTRSLEFACGCRVESWTRFLAFFNAVSRVSVQPSKLADGS